jgi:hypothetical protein
MLEEIQAKMNLSIGQVLQIASFLKEYQFITFDEAQKGIKLEEAVRLFLA